ncbi:MAG: TetR family transcriptional regulator [Solirubrobacteraceae bacterium]
MPEVVPLRDRKRQRARDAIIDTALDLFAERGFAAVSVDDIVKRVEVGRTTFFRYFGDKQEVVFADESRLLDDLVEQLPMANPGPQTLLEALDELESVVTILCKGVAADAKKYRAHAQLLAANPELQARSDAKLRRLTATIERALRERGTPVRLAVLASQLACACYITARQIAGDKANKLVPEVQASFAELVGPLTESCDR